MTARKSVLAQLVLAALAFGYSLYLYPRMPDRVPIHWNMYGQADGWGSKGSSLWFVPTMMLGMILLTLVLPKLSPKNYEIDRFGKTYYWIMNLVSALFAVMHVIIVQASKGGHFEMQKLILAAIFGFFAAMGNVLGTVRRNYFVGIRTPWTLASEKVWEATHRQAAWLWFFGGLIGCLASILGLSFPIGMAFLLILAFIPVINSYFLYKKLES